VGVVAYASEHATWGEIKSQNQSDAPSPAAKVGPPGPMVVGGGLAPNAFAGATDITASFTARETKDGTVKGEAQFIDHSADLKWHHDIDCMFIDGNIAYLSGRIKHGTNLPEGIEPGSPALLWLQDNGEGAGSDRLQAAIGYPDDWSCEDFATIVGPPPEAIQIDFTNANVKILHNE